MYKPISELKLQYETEPERTLLVLTIQDLMYNSYIFRTTIPFFYTSGAFLFIRINVTDFFKRFEDIITDYGFFDDRKMQRV